MQPSNQRPPRLTRSEDTHGTRQGSTAQATRNTSEKNNVDAATINFIKRTLCPSKSGDAATANENALGNLLPPLTSSNQVDVQLYAIIAAILAQFVQSWYNRITPDEVFTAEIIQIIAHCTRGLEGRLREVDLEHLLLHEIPQVVDAHLQAARIASGVEHDKGSLEGTDPFFLRDFGTTFHTLRPHHALSPPPINVDQAAAQRDNEVAWCQLLVDAVLPLLVPPEDLANPCLRTLVSEILSEMIFRNALCGKASEPWLLWESITKIVHLLRTRTGYSRGSASQTTSIRANLASERLEQYGLVAPQGRDSGLDQDAMKPSRNIFDTLVQLFWTAAQLVSSGWTILCLLVVVFRQSSSLSFRGSHGTGSHHATAVGSETRPRPMLSMAIWSCVSHMILLPQRMPWLSGLLELFHWLLLHGPGRFGRTNGTLDRILSAQLHVHLLDRPSLLPPLLAAVRAALFPNNALAPSRPPPSTAEVQAIRRECAESLVDGLPAVIRQRFFAASDRAAMVDDVDRTVCALLRDRYVNKHLIVALTDLIAVRLFPELLEIRDAGD